MTPIIALTDPNDLEVYLPLEENLERGGFNSFEELKTKWESLKWGYNHHIKVNLVNACSQAEADAILTQLDLFPEMPNTEPLVLSLSNRKDTVICDETDVVCFKELTPVTQWYDTPFDEKPRDLYFMSSWAVDCYKGEEYSKDYGYKICPCCGRTICEQNPKNGWETQFRELGNEDDECWEEPICTKCFEEDVIENGVDIDQLLRLERISGSRFSTVELEDAGFEKSEEIDDFLVGSGMSSYNPEEKFFNKIKKMKDRGFFNNHIVVFDYGMMAFGGLGGYVTMYTKQKAI